MTEIQPGHPPGHFYSPVIDPAVLREQYGYLWPEAPSAECPGIDFNDDYHRKVLGEWFPRHLPSWDYPEHRAEAGDDRTYYVRNDQFSYLDARSLFVLLQAWRPRRWVEIGSGYSTLLTADVNARRLGGEMEFWCVEPYPRDFLRESIPGLTTLVEKRVEQVPLADFDVLREGDVLFIDSSHVSKTGSDVNYLVFEVIPRLRRGVKIHFHDIFLPLEYPVQWILDEQRSWNEQYVVRALLMFSSAFRVLFGSSYAWLRFPEEVRDALGYPDRRGFGGGSLWLERV